jgi:acyl-CoA synthetase (AMP-forming)/AMP-acid ligase II
MIVGGSALPSALARAAMARGMDVFGAYGQSESGPMLTAAHVKSKHLAGYSAEELSHRIVAGIAAPMVDLRVVDQNMAEVPHDGEAVGEIIARAPWLTTGYLNNPEASEVLWGGGYLHTGDVASIDADGYIRIADRLKDIVKSGGEWVSSIQLENIIMEKTGVQRAAVIAMKDVKLGGTAACAGPASSRPRRQGRRRRHPPARRFLRRTRNHLEDRDPEERHLRSGAAADLGRQGRQEDIARELHVRRRGRTAGPVSAALSGGLETPAAARPLPDRRTDAIRRARGGRRRDRAPPPSFRDAPGIARDRNRRTGASHRDGRAPTGAPVAPACQ